MSNQRKDLKRNLNEFEFIMLLDTRFENLRWTFRFFRKQDHKTIRKYTIFNLLNKEC